MMILGIEAAAKVCGACVWKDGSVVAEERTFSVLTHSQTLMPMVKAVMDESASAMKDVDYITLTIGPGSFTGLRIGAACAKGLALGQSVSGEDGMLTGGTPLIPVGTLESLAFGADSFLTGGYLLVPIMDARRHQVYGAVYEGTRELVPADAIPPEMLADTLVRLGKPCLFLGDASLLYAPLFSQRLGKLFHVAPETMRSLNPAVTCALAAYKLAEFEQGRQADPRVSGSHLRIRYLRKPQAEREREQRLAAQGREH